MLIRMSGATEKHGFLPNFCDIRLLFAWVLTAELLAVVLSLAAPPAGFLAGLEPALAVCPVGCPDAGRAAVCGRWPPEPPGTPGGGRGGWLLALLVTAALHLVSQRLLRGEWSVAPAALASQLGVAAIISAVALRYLYQLHRHQEKELAEAQARAQALQARIRPHFLFNSMNTIASLTRADPALAEEVVHDLSDLFRASLSGAERAPSLQQELELARGYLRIEQ